MKFKRKKTSPEIPTASMGDVAFLLIIFFILTTTFSINKGFDFGLPPKEQDSTEEQQERRPAVTVIVSPVMTGAFIAGDYKVITIDEEKNLRIFDKNSLQGVYQFMYEAFEKVRTKQEQMIMAGQFVGESWKKLPVYILIHPDAPVDGWVDVWEEIQKLDDHYFPPEFEEFEGVERRKPKKEKLATHIPHVNQFFLILETNQELLPQLREHIPDL